jgi:membrane-associated phospholipid phosphatase
MNSIRKPNPWLILFFAAWIVLALVFAFADLRISQAVYNPGSIWAKFMEGYGQSLGSLVCFLAASLLFRLRPRTKTFKGLASAVLVFLASVLFSLAVWAEWFQKLPGNTLPVLVLAMLSVLAAQLWLGTVDEARLRKFEAPAKVAVLLFFLAPVITTWAIKVSWGRWTYRDLLPDLSRFTPWYLPQGNTGHYSFPSGHTSVIGAHFASDVLFGAGQTGLWFWLLSRRMIRPA